MLAAGLTERYRLDLRRPAQPAAAGFLLMLSLAACSDGATRIAYQIEAEAPKAAKSVDGRHTITHFPKREWDSGCADAYRIQFSEKSLLVIWCIDSKTGETTGSHSTSYHLRFVDVPGTWIVDKAAGQPTYIDLQKSAEKPLVVNVR